MDWSLGIIIRKASVTQKTEKRINAHMIISLMPQSVARAISSIRMVSRLVATAFLSRRELRRSARPLSQAVPHDCGQLMHL